jgi:hypothetical protein
MSNFKSNVGRWSKTNITRRSVGNCGQPKNLVVCSNYMSLPKSSWANSQNSPPNNGEFDGNFI